MPVDRAVFIEVVGYVQADVLPFTQADKRTGHCAIHREGMSGATASREMRVANRQFDVFA